MGELRSCFVIVAFLHCFVQLGLSKGWPEQSLSGNCLSTDPVCRHCCLALCIAEEEKNTSSFLPAVVVAFFPSDKQVLLGASGGVSGTERLLRLDYYYHSVQSHSTMDDGALYCTL